MPLLSLLMGKWEQVPSIHVSGTLIIWADNS